MEPVILSFQDARRCVEQQAAKLHAPASEPVQLLLAGGRVLAEPVLADRDFPPFARATRDGYAVCAADVAHVPARLKLVGEIRAGGEPQGLEIQAGECVEIMTGAPVPASADAVVMVEYTAGSANTVEVQRSIAAGENIVPAGAEARRGEVLLCPGTRLTPAAIAVAGSCGRHELRVYKRPHIAILSTGDELVDVAAEPAPNQIRNSNSYSLAAQVERAGGVPVILPIAPDRLQPLRHLVQQGLATDLLLLSGGVSMGKYDLVEQVLADLGAEFFFTGAQIQPGRPVVFGRAPAREGAQPTYFFGLPGNPVSTMVCFELFARAMVEALSGALPTQMVFPQARLKSDVKVKTGLTRFLPALLSGAYQQAEVELLKWQGSGDMAATARANCYLVVPPDREKLSAGDMVSVLLV
jgi:molybdopterin molybdotransferase